MLTPRTVSFFSLPDLSIRLLLLWNTIISVTEAGSSQYCWYLHEDYHTIQQTYCPNGCCRDYGDEGEICCFAWTVGVILGVAFACITFVSVTVVVIICCYHSKKKHNRTGVVMAPTQATNSTVIYSSAAYAYPHPPSGYYPTSQFPNAPPTFLPPPQSDAAYPPSYAASVQPPYGAAPYATYSQGAGNPADQYGGYGTGK